ncbi:MAG: TonB-dependent receptor [Pseudomonadota bacterium]
MPRPQSVTPCILSLLIAGLVPGQPSAEGTGQNDEAAENAALFLDPITVTARKREEELGDVPISVNVIRPESTTLTPFESAGSIAGATPNLTINESGNTRLTFGNIRGVGILAQPLSPVDTAIGWATDGTVQPTFGSNTQLLDIERIEVLRGPQNTLFGRGTQGGAVNIVTGMPSFERRASVTAEIGENQFGFVDAIVTGALIPDQLAGRLALRFSTFGGDIENVSAGGEDGEAILGAARGSLLFTPTDRTTVVVRGFFEEDRRDTPAFLFRDADDFPSSGINPENDLDRRVFNASLEVEHVFDPVVLTSISSFHFNEQDFTSDLTDALIFAPLTGQPPTAFDTPGESVRIANLRENAFQQELRLSAREEDALQWVVGANVYYSNFDLEGEDTDPFSPFNNSIVDTRLDTLSYAIFANVSAPLFGPLSASAGLRVGRDEQDLESSFDSRGTPGIVPGLEEEGRFTDTFVLGGASLSYALDEDNSLYASVRRGRTTGGFATLNRNQFVGERQEPRPSSVSWTYEIGAKLSLLDGRFLLNGAAFFNDVKDAALFSFDPALVRAVPVPLDYESYGFELEAAGDLGAGFVLRAGVGFTKAEFVGIGPDDVSGAFNGGRVPNVPRWSSAVALENRTPIALLGRGTNVDSRLEWQFQGAREADVANSFSLDSYHVFNAQVGLTVGGVSVYGFARNLTDERFETLGVRFGPTVETVSVGRGRVVGVGATVRF